MRKDIMKQTEVKKNREISAAKLNNQRISQENKQKKLQNKNTYTKLN